MGSGSPCSRCILHTSERYTFMDCGFKVRVRYEVYSMSVCSGTNMGDPLEWSWLYVRLNVMKLHVAALYVVRVDVVSD